MLLCREVWDYQEEWCLCTKEGANCDMQVEECSTDADKSHGVSKYKRSVSSSDVDDLDESQEEGWLQQGGESNKGHINLPLDDTIQDSECWRISSQDQHPLQE